MSLVSSLPVTFGLVNVRAETPGQVSSPAELVGALHTAFGAHHARAVHAKGVFFEGIFTPDPQAASLTKAFHLQKESSRVFVRFSNFTGIPNIPDNSPAANPRGLAIKFTTEDGVSTDIVSHSFNGFPTATSDQFRELLLAIGASGPDAAKPNAVDRFLETHPVAKVFLTTQKNPASYGTINYYGVNSFQFTNRQGKSHYIRYQFVPEAGEKLLNADEMEKAGAEYLADEIHARIAHGTIGFKLYAQVAEDGDEIANPSIAWSAQRKRVFLGTIKIEKLGSNTPDGDKKLSFNPGNLPDGINPADPMLTLRTAGYPVSVHERR